MARTIISCFAWLFAFVACASAENIQWQSAATGKMLQGRVLPPSSPTAGPVATVVYLKNLAVPRIGRQPDETILEQLRQSGHLVLVLDYEKDARAVSPNLNADLLKLRTDITDAKRPTLHLSRPVDANHLFILCEGFQLKRDVPFAQDGKRTLAMDICYPADPQRPVPMLMEITCDNTHRMGSFSLLFCHDTLLEGAQAAGFATAMVDHPVPPPYKGLDDPMPQIIPRLKAAVRELRLQAAELKTSDKIGVIGFSRGGPMAAFLATTNDRPDLEPQGAVTAISSNVQAALIHGNRYDYLHLLPQDPMISRFEKLWGKAAENKEAWAVHGASNYLTGSAVPMFLNTSNTESAEYQQGLSDFEKRLSGLGVEHVYQVDQDGRGHRVSTDPATLQSIYSFFARHLQP